MNIIRLISSVVCTQMLTVIPALFAAELPEKAVRVLTQLEVDTAKIREKAIVELERLRKEEERNNRTTFCMEIDRKLDELRTLTLLPNDLLGDVSASYPQFTSVAKQSHLFSRASGADDPKDRTNAEVRIGKKMAMGGRGFTVLALDTDGTTLISKTYDPHSGARKVAMARFATDMAELPNGAIVGIALYELGAADFTADATLAIRSVGGDLGLMGAPPNSSYILLGIKGMERGTAIEIRKEGETAEYPEQKGTPPKGTAGPSVRR